MTTSPSSFFGRVRERERFKRALEQRSGAYLRFYGIGGIGKSALLRQLYADATGGGGNLPPITPYVVLLDLEQIATPVQFFDSLIASLEGTGKTHRRHLLFLRKDTLAACRRLVAALAAQSAASARKLVDARISAERGSQVGDVSIQATLVHDKAAPPVTIEDVLRAFRQAVANDLPALVTMPSGTQVGYQPKRLLVLLCDSLDKTSQEVRNILRDLWSGVLEERCILVCAGREEERRKDGQPLAQYELGALEPAAIDSWLTKSQVDDPALRTAIVELCHGVPMMLVLAIERVAAARAQGRSLSPADFRPPQSSQGGEIAREVVETFLVQGYLSQLEQGNPQDQQQVRLISRGCILRRFEPQEVISALGIVGRDDAGPLLHRLTERGFLAHRRMHEVIRRTARDLLRTDEPEYFQELLVNMERYYEQRGAAYEADVLYARLLRGDSTAARDLLASVGRRLQAGDLPGAAELIAAAQEADPPEASRWYVELAKADLALAEGSTARAGERLLRLIDSAEGDQERADLIRQRLGTIWLSTHPQLTIWLFRHSPPDAHLLQSALTMAHALRQQSKWPLAISAYTVAYEIAQTTEDRQGQAEALLGLGEVAQQRGELEVATEHYRQALALYQAVESRGGQAQVLFGLGEVAGQRGDLAAATEHYYQALALFQAVEIRLGQALALWGLGKVARQRGDLAAATEHYYQALALFQAVESRGGQAQALRGLGDVAQQRGELAAAAEHYRQALALYQAVEDRQGQAQALRGLGDVARLRDDLVVATEYYHQALALYQAVESRHGQATVLQGLGNVARQRGELAGASEHYHQALALYQAVEDRQGQANALQGLGAVARQRGELAGASEHYHQALALYQAVEGWQGQANALRGLGAVAQQRGELEVAAEHYRQALALYQAVEDRQGQANALRGLGAVAIGRSQLRDARSYVQEALRLSKAVEDLAGQYWSWDLLAQIAAAEGNTAEAIYCRQEIQSINDELRSRR